MSWPPSDAEVGSGPSPSTPPTALSRSTTPLPDSAPPQRHHPALLGTSGELSRDIVLRERQACVLRWLRAAHHLPAEWAGRPRPTSTRIEAYITLAAANQQMEEGWRRKHGPRGLTPSFDVFLALAQKSAPPPPAAPEPSFQVDEAGEVSSRARPRSAEGETSSMRPAAGAESSGAPLPAAGSLVTTAAQPRDCAAAPLLELAAAHEAQLHGLRLRWQEVSSQVSILRRRLQEAVFCPHREATAAVRPDDVEEIVRHLEGAVRRLRAALDDIVSAPPTKRRCR